MKKLESSDLRQAIHLLFLLKGRPLCLYAFIVIYNPILRDNYVLCFAVRQQATFTKPQFVQEKNKVRNPLIFDVRSKKIKFQKTKALQIDKQL